jgi:hypothetical protein
MFFFTFLFLILAQFRHNFVRQFLNLFVFCFFNGGNFIVTEGSFPSRGSIDDGVTMILSRVDEERPAKEEGDYYEGNYKSKIPKLSASMTSAPSMTPFNWVVTRMMT